jgi:DnaJ-class molecular chaperone
MYSNERRPSFDRRRALLACAAFVTFVGWGTGCGQPVKTPAQTKQDCPACRGTGRITGPCAVCNGTGNLGVGVGDVKTPLPFRACGGNGTVAMICSRCSGTGKILILESRSSQPTSDTSGPPAK